MYASYQLPRLSRSTFTLRSRVGGWVVGRSNLILDPTLALIRAQLGFRIQVGAECGNNLRLSSSQLKLPWDTKKLSLLLPQLSHILRLSKSMAATGGGLIVFRFPRLHCMGQILTLKGPDTRFSKTAVLPVKLNTDTYCTPSRC